MYWYISTIFPLINQFFKKKKDWWMIINVTNAPKERTSANCDPLHFFPLSSFLWQHGSIFSQSHKYMKYLLINLSNEDNVWFIKIRTTHDLSLWLYEYFWIILLFGHLVNFILKVLAREICIMKSGFAKKVIIKSQKQFISLWIRGQLTPNDLKLLFLSY